MSAGLLVTCAMHKLKMMRIPCGYKHRDFFDENHRINIGK